MHVKRGVTKERHQEMVSTLEAAGIRKQTLPSSFPCWSPEQSEQQDTSVCCLSLVHTVGLSLLPKPRQDIRSNSPLLETKGNENKCLSTQVGYQWRTTETVLPSLT